jgi:methyltransferase (TIGR00027 family)
MQPDRPSRTSLTVAAARAAHLVVDAEPWIFRDPLAATLLGRQARELIDQHRLYPGHRLLSATRVETLCRSRYTEDRLAEAVQRGVDQYVVLGAGLDTFALRSAEAAGPAVFEVDHPASQDRKRQSLSLAGLDLPPRLALVPVDLETDDLVERLVRHGFDPTRPAFVSCLGVSMYLTKATLARTVTALGALAEGSELVVDHILPRESLDRPARAFVDVALPAVAASGEPWRSRWTSAELTAVLNRHGFATVVNRPQRELIEPALWQRTDGLRPMGISAVAHATITA